MSGGADVSRGHFEKLMLFSVIIPSYNRARFIEATLESVRAQECQDYETIVVDDGSTDETMSILGRHPSVQVLRQDNKGRGPARNYGVSKSSGEYIAFLDSDDIWFPWTLQTFADVIRDQNEPDLIAARLFEFWNDRELEAIKKAPLEVDVFDDYYAASHKSYFVGACMTIIRREAFLAVGGFTSRPIYAEDCDLALRLGLVRKFVQILAPVTLGYRQHGTNARRDYARLYSGTVLLVDSERAGRYPGEAASESDRLRLVTLHTRPFSVACIKHGWQRYGWDLYWKTFGWHLRLLRWKYLLGFPVLAAWCALRRQTTGETAQIREETP